MTDPVSAELLSRMEGGRAVKWWDWTNGVARCPSSWVEPGRTFQCQQDQGHDGNHHYRDWQWDSNRNGRRRKADALRGRAVVPGGNITSERHYEEALTKEVSDMLSELGIPQDFWPAQVVRVNPALPAAGDKQ